LLESFNLLISTSRRNERNACSELWYLLKEIGDKEPKVDATYISGLIVASSQIDPIKVIEEFKNLIKEKPWQFRYVKKVVPIQIIIPTSIESIKQSALNIVINMNSDKKYRILIRKRSTNLSSSSLIDAIAPKINNKVDLANPDIILLIEIIGEVTGISLINPNNILSIERNKRELLNT